MTPEQLVGQTIGEYQLEGVIGRGGMSVVYRARTPQHESVALKVLFPPPDTGTETLARFEREARTAARLNHPGLVPVLDAGHAEGRTYMAMQLVKGQTLSERMAQNGRLDEETAADIAWQVADALFYAHGQGVVHRDIKPSNILLTEDGRALLTDFGVAQALDDPALTRTGYTVGTPAYMAPEQAAGDQEVDGRADLYSLGVVLYQMVTGRLPFQGGTPQVLHAHVYTPPPLPSSIAAVSPGMERVILQAMSKAATERFQTGATLAQALNNIEDYTRIKVPLPTTADKTTAKPWYTRLGVWVSLLTAAAIIIAAWEFTGFSFTATEKTPIIPSITLIAEFEPTWTPSATPTVSQPVSTPMPAPNPITPTLPPVATPVPTDPELPYPAGTLLKGSGDGVFRMHADGTLQHIYDFTTFQAFAFSEQDILNVEDTVLDSMTISGELTRLLAGPNDNLDWIVAGERWRIAAWQTELTAHPYQGLPPSLVDTQMLDGLPLVEFEDLRAGTLIKDGDNHYQLFAENTLRRFQTDFLIFDYGYGLPDFVEIPSEVRHLYRTGPDLTPVLQAEDGEDLFLIAAGERQPLADQEAAFALGYGVEQISEVPADFLDDIPLVSEDVPPTAEPTPTVPANPTPAPTATPCPQLLAEPLASLENSPIWDQLGCPTGPALLTPAAWQSFEQGQLLWRQDRSVIYVLGSEGHWFFVGDTWEDGDEEIDPSILPDQGFYQPKRGFGKVWREQPGVRADLGWATGEETGFTATIQAFDTSEVWYNPDEQVFAILFSNNTYQIFAEEGLE